MIPDDPLPTPKQRELLCDMIHYAFVELRMLGRNHHSEQSADLADAFHNISKEMYGWGGFNWDIFRGVLKQYQDKWRESDVCGRNFVEMLDEIRQQA
jgi:hypothetical protein